MKKVARITVSSFVAFALGVALVNTAYAEVTGHTFRVTVKTSFGTTFTDCFRFDVPGAGDLTIDHLGEVITYRHGQLDTVDVRFKAVSRSGQPLAIMFFGEEVEALEMLTGEAVNELGDTFVFSGLETGPSTSPSLCVLDPGILAGRTGAQNANTLGEYYRRP